MLGSVDVCGAAAIGTGMQLPQHRRFPLHMVSPPIRSIIRPDRAAPIGRIPRKGQSLRRVSGADAELNIYEPMVTL